MATSKHHIQFFSSSVSTQQWAWPFTIQLLTFSSTLKLQFIYQQSWKSDTTDIRIIVVHDNRWFRLTADNSKAIQTESYIAQFRSGKSECSCSGLLSSESFRLSRSENTNPGSRNCWCSCTECRSVGPCQMDTPDAGQTTSRESQDQY